MTTTINATGGTLPAVVSSVMVPVGLATSEEISVTPLEGTTVILGMAQPALVGSHANSAVIRFGSNGDSQVRGECSHCVSLAASILELDQAHVQLICGTFQLSIEFLDPQFRLTDDQLNELFEYGLIQCRWPQI